MSQLIKLRQQIKTIKTIQKITQAMRLVSMSIHSRLNNQKVFLNNYQSELNLITQLINSAKAPAPEENLPIKKRLIILIGSQKGLCGTFNQDVLHKFYKFYDPSQYTELLVIGKKLVDTVQRKHHIEQKIIKFTHSALPEIVNKIVNYINNQHTFSEVVCLSNSSKNFFVHLTKLTTVWPLPANSYQVAPIEPYTWEQPASQISSIIDISQLKLNIYCLLFDSLIAEYAARFRSMDNATRNANNLLETAERQYRKVRQTKITRELVELSAIFQTK